MSHCDVKTYSFLLLTIRLPPEGPFSTQLWNHRGSHVEPEGITCSHTFPLFSHPHRAQASGSSGCHTSLTLAHLGPGDMTVVWSWSGQACTEEVLTGTAQLTLLSGLAQEGTHPWRVRVVPAENIPYRCDIAQSNGIGRRAT